VSSDVIHRIIERQTTLDGSRLALIDGKGPITYRALNARANALARVLMCAGLRHAGHALVAADPGADLAAMLLAVLKAGGAYSWMGGSDGRSGNAMLSIRTSPGNSPDEYLVIDGDVESSATHASPNLPVMARGCDVACVLAPFTAAPVQVPHAAIAARRGSASANASGWNDDPTATRLLIALMNGQTVTMEAGAATAA
jgi:hypothetical protein